MIKIISANTDNIGNDIEANSLKDNSYDAFYNPSKPHSFKIVDSHFGYSSVLMEMQEMRYNYIQYQNFLEQYKDLAKDISGCYIILIFSESPNATFTNYKDVYVGQSINVHQRVRNHLTGHGNGDVYAEIKYGTKQGKKIYVLIIPWEKKYLNIKETELIAKYNAMESFNKTAGGSAQR